MYFCSRNLGFALPQICRKISIIVINGAYTPVFVESVEIGDVTYLLQIYIDLENSLVLEEECHQT